MSEIEADNASESVLRDAIKQLRHEIRWHRDQIGDYRCWLDDDKLYKALPEGDGIHHAPPPEEFRRLCVEFWQNRQRPDEPLNNDVVRDSQRESLVLSEADDADVYAMNREQLFIELKKLTDGIQQHHNVLRSQRRWEDDKKLYLLLPEKRLAIWQLPDKKCFMESCDRFNESRQQNPTKLHAWDAADH